MKAYRADVNGNASSRVTRLAHAPLCKGVQALFLFNDEPNGRHFFIEVYCYHSLLIS